MSEAGAAAPTATIVASDQQTAEPVSTVWGMLGAMDYMSIGAQMIISALFIIYVGAHASLRRPPSAAPPRNPKMKNGKPVDDRELFAQGFRATDALLFPFIAASFLIGLYYLIKWLQDPSILNQILRLYMAITGVFSAGVLFGDSLRLLSKLVFPDYWMDGSGLVFKIDPRSLTQKLLKSPGEEDSEAIITGAVDPEKTTPLPGFASQLALSARAKRAVWKTRHFLMEDWFLRVSIYAMGDETEPFFVTSLVGFLIGIVVQVMYLYTSSTSLSNIIGFAVCYMAFMYTSVTSFFIGSLVLVGLFVYDIVMVFYTPFMVAVATQVDAPIKITYGTATRSNLLGLGDIVVPGIFICLALRFDLWRHYQKKITRESTELETVTKKDESGEPIERQTDGTANGEVTTVETAYRTVKAPFVDPRGQWGNYLWTTRIQDLISFSDRQPALKSLSEASFAKTYFTVTIIGYLVGMLATLIVLLIFKRGQPALLYLVPCVVGSAWLTGFVRGEIKDMWNYTEDGSLDVEDVVVDVDGEGKVIKEKKNDKGAAAKKEEMDSKKDNYELFLFSITAPKEDTDKED